MAGIDAERTLTFDSAYSGFAPKRTPMSGTRDRPNRVDSRPGEPRANQSPRAESGRHETQISFDDHAGP